MVHPEAGSCPVCGMELVPRDSMTFVAILVFDGVQIIDFTGPYEVFGQAGFHTYLVSPDGAPVSTAMDMRVVPNHSFADAPAPDVLLVPGGGIGTVLKDEATLEWIRRSAAGADHVLSVCTGAQVLAEAGLLDGLRATTFHKALVRVAGKYPEVEVLAGARFVDNGKVVTSAGLSAGLDAALHVVAEIQGGAAARRLADHLEYAWRSDSGEATARRLGGPLDSGRRGDFDGRYEHEGETRVVVAASPLDHRLYAFVGNERFPLVWLGGDRFLNAAREEVVFVRDESGAVVGYRSEDSPDRVFRRLTSDGGLPPEIWRSRPHSASGASEGP